MKYFIVALLLTLSFVTSAEGRLWDDHHEEGHLWDAEKIQIWEDFAMRLSSEDKVFIREWARNGRPHHPHRWEHEPEIPEVPVPAAMRLFASALLGLVGINRGTKVG